LAGSILYAIVYYDDEKLNKIKIPKRGLQMKLARVAILVSYGLLGMTVVASAASGPTCRAFDDSEFVCYLLDPPSSGDAPLLMKPATCFCKYGGQTPAYTGTGASCSDAEASVLSQIDAWLAGRHICTNTDGVCDFTFVVSQPCTFNSTTGLYQETGFKKYRCLLC
jgi:hypothetical protein